MLYDIRAVYWSHSTVTFKTEPTPKQVLLRWRGLIERVILCRFSLFTKTNVRKTHSPCSVYVIWVYNGKVFNRITTYNIVL